MSNWGGPLLAIFARGRIAARLLTPYRRYPICGDSSFQFLAEIRDVGRDAALVIPESIPEARR